MDVEKLEAEFYEVKNGKLPQKFVEFVLRWMNELEERVQRLEKGNK